jgi:2-polyprenyl-3-methyl-5-hydroxy-6-metoxy-1,4-benzoquinol methylase
LTLAFLDSQLPSLLRVGRVRVLEIGCGSGSLAGTLANVGYHGTYLGVDVQDRFDRSTAVPEFEKTFIHADARGLEPGQAFDLVISISALEHIPDDSQLTNRLGTFLAPGGIQLHFVPSAWGLAVYLWHGYRQYTRSSLADRFDPDTTVAFALGGGASFVLHFLAITVGEVLLRIPVRRRWSGIYDRLLAHSLRLDPLLPICSTVYAVYQAPSRPESRCS